MRSAAGGGGRGVRRGCARPPCVLTHRDDDRMMSLLGSSGVEMLVTQPEWPLSVARWLSVSAILAAALLRSKACGEGVGARRVVRAAKGGA